MPFLSSISFTIPVLIVSDTEYNRKVPVIKGTNVKRLCKQSVPEDDVPAEWQLAFDSLCDDSLPVRTTNNLNIRVGPRGVKVLHGFARKTKDFETAVTEHIDSSLPGSLTVCPRLGKKKNSCVSGSPTDGKFSGPTLNFFNIRKK